MTRFFSFVAVIASALVFSGTAAGGHLPGETITNQKGTTLQFSLLNNILSIERQRAPACKMPRVIETVIVGEPRRLNGGRMMQWTERWTLDRCGANSIYVIDFDFRGSVGHYKIKPPKS